MEDFVALLEAQAGIPPEKFWEKMYPYALDVAAELEIPPSVCLAQWAIESSFESPRWCDYNNYAGITDGGPPHFRRYDTIDDFIRDYIRVLRLSYYREVLELAKQHAPAEEIARALGRSPWDAGHYGGDGKNLIAVMRRYNLFLFDPAWWAYRAWRWGVRRGVTDGTAPSTVATREMVVTMLYRALVGEGRE
ncbi:hypothetical protein HPY42_06520 [Coprothermobacteraceae bacterium]|nr:hypothetical protein [Coprothermobacteraceae bacterium]